jgi:hypothetical protein
MQTKLCRDEKCKRAGIDLPLTEFPRNKRSSNGRGTYCRECTCRRMDESRARGRVVRQAQKAAREAANIQPKIQRKPAVIAKVEKAIENGATREQIQRRTKLTYDQLGKVLVKLVWESKTVEIKRVDGKRLFVPRAA